MFSNEILKFKINIFSVTIQSLVKMHPVVIALILITINQCSCNPASKIYFNCTRGEKVVCEAPRLHTQIKSDTDVQVSVPGETVEEVLFPGFSKINYIPIKIFKKCPNLKVVTAHDLNLYKIDKKTFIEASNLEKFLANGNQIRELTDHTFAGARNLELIELYDNEITAISAKAFAGLGKLERLQLGKNSIKELDDHAFLPLINLRTIYIHHGDISTISKELFSTTTLLEEVYMDNQKINKIHPKFAENLKNIRVLKLIDNVCVRLQNTIATLDEDLKTCYENYTGDIKNPDGV